MADSRPLRGSRNRNGRNFSLGEVGGGQGGSRAVRHVSQDYCAGVLSYILYGNERFFDIFFERRMNSKYFAYTFVSKVGGNWTIKYFDFCFVSTCANKKVST